ncbi:TPA: DotI/IcmL/TraM family protein [Klebsiella aerogenes]
MTDNTLPGEGLKNPRLHSSRDINDPISSTIRDASQQTSIARSSLKVSGIQAYVIAVSVTLNLFLGYAAVHPNVIYFAFDHGRLTDMHPLTKPYYTPADVIQFGSDTLINTLSLDFVNWRHQLEMARPRFDTKGFASVIKQLQANGMLDLIKKQRMNMTVTAGTGVLTKQGLENGAFTWVIETPITIKLAGQTSQLADQKFIATLHIHQVDPAVKPQGIEVTLMLTKPARGGE